MQGGSFIPLPFWNRLYALYRPSRPVALAPHQQSLRLFLNYRLITSDPVQVNGTTVAARQFLRAHLLQETTDGRAPDVGEWAYLLHIEVLGTRSGRHARRIYRTSHPPMSDWRRAATARMTGIPASIGIQLLAHGEGRATGMLAPEAAFDPTRFFGELARHLGGRAH